MLSKKGYQIVLAQKSSRLDLANMVIKFRDTPPNIKLKGVMSIYAKTVLRISKIFWIMTMGYVSIQIFN